MQINKVQSPNFGMAMKIRPEATKFLLRNKHGIDFINAIDDLGKRVANTKYVDIEIGSGALPNLKFQGERYDSQCINWEDKKIDVILRVVRDKMAPLEKIEMIYKTKEEAGKVFEKLMSKSDDLYLSYETLAKVLDEHISNNIEKFKVAELFRKYGEK